MRADANRGRLAARVQALLGEIYDLEPAPDIRDFLVTDRERLPPLDRDGDLYQDEELLVASDGDDLAVSLYVDARVFARLARRDPLRRLDASNVSDWWTLLEGVSHFAYLAHNARFDRPVDRLTLELQAEVDKYVATLWLLRRQRPTHVPLELHPLLFERARIDPVRAGRYVGLYATASRHAGAFCRRLERSLARARERARPFVAEHLTELRRFYRLGSAQKLASCES